MKPPSTWSVDLPIRVGVACTKRFLAEARHLAETVGAEGDPQAIVRIAEMIERAAVRTDELWSALKERTDG
jgi:hypothetical protein